MAQRLGSLALLLGAAVAAPIPPPCCQPDGAWRCAGPCFINGTIVAFTERDVLTSFGGANGAAFLNNTIHNSKTSFTEFEVYTQLPNDCHVCRHASTLPASTT